MISTHDSDELAALLARAALGDQSAFAEFYDRTAARAYGLIKRLLKKPELAEDVTAEVFLQVWRQAATFDGTRGSALTWLMTIARSRALDAIRRRAREPQHFFDDAQMEDLVGTCEDATAVVQQFEYESYIALALLRLSDVQRHLVALAFFEDLSHSEIAERVAMPLGTVKSTLRAALGILRANLINPRLSLEESL